MAKLLRNLKLATAMLLFGSLNAAAIPAKPGLMEYKNADGSIVTVTLHGDENGGYYMSQDGYVLLPDGAGNLCYATGTANAVAPSRVIAKDASARTEQELRFIETLDKDQLLTASRNKVQALRAQSKVNRSAGKRKIAAIDRITNYPTTGSPKGLVLLVQFKDIKFQTPNAHEAFNDLINKPGYDYNGATGSARDYFVENSGGLYQPDFNVYGPITVPNNENYYGAPEGAFVRDCRPWQMVIDAVDQLIIDEPELNLADYDCDGDGFVDNIFVYFAGYGQNEGGPDWTIWPHSADIYNLYGVTKEVHGVKLGNYACTNELTGNSGVVRAGIGTFVHEFSHVLGLPDLYSTNGSGAFTPNYYEVMDIGPYLNNGNTPPYMSAFDRYSLGWLNFRELTGPENIELSDIRSNEALLIPTLKDEEFFVLENRQNVGWDTYIPGHGMLIWHIDYDRDAWINNTVNNDVSHQRVDIIEADGVASATTMPGDPFPGTTNVTEFTSTSRPAMTTWIGVPVNMPITTIREQDGIIYFRVKGGGDRIEPVNALEATNITPVSFTANWEARAGATGYEIDICANQALVPFTTLRVANETSVEVTGLEPETMYSYVVRVVESDRKSEDSNRIMVTTPEPYFSMTVPVLNPASDIQHTSFVASWNEHANAAGYLLNVYEKKVLTPKNTVVDFTRNGDMLVPEGWYTNCTQTASLSGFFGQSRPSLQMSSNGDQVASPEFDGDVNAISFWYRGNNNVEGNSISIEILNEAGAWVNIHTVNDIVEAAGGETVGIGPDFDAQMPVGARAVRIVFKKSASAGTVYLDDVSVDYAGDYEAAHIEGYKAADMGNVLSATVTGLQPLHHYFFSVVAYNAEGELSGESAEQSLYTPESGSVDTVGISDITITAANGTISVNGAKGLVELFDIAGRLVASAKGNARFTALSEGVYIVTADGQNYKVAL